LNLNDSGIFSLLLFNNSNFRNSLTEQRKTQIHIISLKINRIEAFCNDAIFCCIGNIWENVQGTADLYSSKNVLIINQCIKGKNKYAIVDSKKERLGCINYDFSKEQAY